MRVTGLGKGYCFSVRVGHPWPGPASVPGATHYKTAPLANPLSNSVFFSNCKTGCFFREIVEANILILTPNDSNAHLYPEPLTNADSKKYVGYY